MNSRLFIFKGLILFVASLIWWLPGFEVKANDHAHASAKQVGLITKEKLKSGFLLSTNICENVTEIPQIECKALLALYKSTDGDYWLNNNNWLQTNTPCNWFGVVCQGGYVNGLALTNNQLIGNIPSELGNLSNLSTLYLDHNQLSGSIPPELSNLINVYWFRLNNNQLTGKIPPEFGNLNRGALILSNNQLSGCIPPELGNIANLGGLDLSHNQLGCDIPPELGNLSHLLSLDLSSNQLTGNIPPELGNPYHLEGLYLNNNQLNGNIPSELGTYEHIWEINLSENQLSGSIPQSFINLSELYFFHFHGTELCEPQNAAFQIWLSGLIDVSSTGIICQICDDVTEIPRSECEVLVTLYNSTNGDSWMDKDGWLQTNMPCDWYGIICNQGNIIKISLNGNFLAGIIPPELGNLNQLQSLKLVGNQLVGSIPSELGDLNQLQTLELMHNQLTGDIPSELGNLSHLHTLRLYYNQLNGGLPLELGNLNNLEYLELWKNELNGNIPATLGNLANLRKLELQQNQLNGSLPPELGNLNTLEYFEIGSNELSGSIPLSFINLSDLFAFLFYDTDLCEPHHAEFQDWLSDVGDVSSTGVICPHLLIDEDDLVLTWYPVPNAVYYNIYRSNLPYFTPNTPYYQQSNPDIPFQDIGAAAENVNYFYLVTAVDNQNAESQIGDEMGYFVFEIEQSQ